VGDLHSRLAKGTNLPGRLPLTWGQIPAAAWTGNRPWCGTGLPSIHGGASRVGTVLTGSEKVNVKTHAVPRL